MLRKSIRWAATASLLTGPRICAQEAMARPDTLPPAIADRVVGNWILGDFEADPITDLGRTLAFASSSEPDVASLVIRCHGDEWDLYIDWDDVIAVEPHDVTLRIGSQGIVDTKTWNPSANGTASFFPDELGQVVEFVEWALLPPRDVLIARTVGRYSAEHTAIFPLEGIGEVYSRMKDHCTPSGSGQS